jgi:hypothetical protein
MNRSQIITNTLLHRTLLILLILPFTFLIIGAKWVEKPVENLDAIVGKWKGSGLTTSGSTFDVWYVFRKDGSFDSVANGGSWSRKFEPPPGALHVTKGGKLEYRNQRGTLRTGVLYEDRKGRRKITFEGETGAKWDVKPVKK